MSHSCLDMRLDRPQTINMRPAWQPPDLLVKNFLQVHRIRMPRLLLVTYYLNTRSITRRTNLSSTHCCAPDTDNPPRVRAVRNNAEVLISVSFVAPKI